MIGWIILGVIVYIIVGIFLVSFFMDVYNDSYGGVVLAWPLLLFFCLIGGIIEGIEWACRIVRKYVWRKDE